jgi:hypothetical protein
VLERLRIQAETGRPFVLLMGASGSGKSIPCFGRCLTFAGETRHHRRSRTLAACDFSAWPRLGSQAKDWLEEAEKQLAAMK